MVKSQKKTPQKQKKQTNRFKIQDWLLTCDEQDIILIFSITYYFELQDPPNLNSLDEDVVAERQRVTSLMRDSHQNSDALLV
jgi:hypothetical protein